MLKFVNKIVILTLTKTILICAQNDLLIQKKLADSIFYAENYFDAIKEYKRLHFFDKEKLYDFYSYYQIALCYKYGGKFEQAHNYFSLALIKAETVNQIFDVKINLCRLNIIENKLENAHRILDDLEKNYSTNDFADQIKFWRGWAFFYEKNWNSAFKIFFELNYFELADIVLKIKSEYYSIEKSKTLSMLLPGLGQFHTANYISGIGSFLWNLLTGYLTINAFWNERIFDGIIFSNLLWLRFYRGNIQNAEKFAIEKNNELFKNTLNYIYKNFPHYIP